jgi:hypothetical protein
MVDAMHSLWLARGELKHSGNVFGAHRDRAIGAVDEAIEQLHDALKFQQERERKTAKRTP